MDRLIITDMMAEAMRSLPDDRREAVFLALMDYAVDGVEPDEGDPRRFDFLILLKYSSGRIEDIDKMESRKAKHRDLMRERRRQGKGINRVTDTKNRVTCDVTVSHSDSRLVTVTNGDVTDDHGDITVTNSDVTVMSQQSNNLLDDIIMSNPKQAENQPVKEKVEGESGLSSIKSIIQGMIGKGDLPSHDTGTRDQDLALTQTRTHSTEKEKEKDEEKDPPLMVPEEKESFPPITPYKEKEDPSLIPLEKGEGKERERGEQQFRARTREGEKQEETLPAITTGGTKDDLSQTFRARARVDDDHDVTRIDWDGLVRFFNDTTGGIFGRIKPPLGETRKGMVRARVAEHGKKALMDAIIMARQSPFLCGHNDKGWMANFDWIIRPNNFEKIISGNYGTRTMERKENEWRNAFDGFIPDGNDLSRKFDPEFERALMDGAIRGMREFEEKERERAERDARAGWMQMDQPLR